ncbi:UDP-4-amino-4,6-dideoxy-N-acetyl-beta-L-altrosamine transaminase [Pedobacter cryoconitis]|uniref:UDP-4-amino-4, 6-dideoxy-N-acetyl-beta-L-altrosamine transaminase n=1 Tax=Pedobacter cryoconitis TaxID=188932 RepID=A0A327T6P1_9SPHI|nr:UDP-4-amino-4,6-dideoxy-N-acetyl-beta-L-altrosamine transaminase [Pedobacter cryoconitis]RAJ33477.1 hypothetical protein LY11_01526 [Pedobacter cryoconitis]
MEKIIPYGRQNITEDDILAVIETLKSDFLTQGPKVLEFEKNFASYIGCKYAVAVSNGTAALHLCALAIGISEGDKVITTPITFSASANCIRYCGGEVVFSDIDPNTLLIDIPKVRLLLEKSPRGTFKGIIPVDFAGRPVNLEVLRKLADEFGLWIIEDACHAPGAYFVDEKRNIQNCGNGKYADLAIFSFHPVKHIATAEGGMITTNNKELYDALLIYRTHGITNQSALFQNSMEFANGGDKSAHKYPNWYMELQELGYNYRLTDMQAALGITQLQKADVGLIRRKEIALNYDIAFDGHKNVVSKANELKKDESFSHAYHLYIILVKDRLGLYNYLREKNIYAQIHYIPLHLMPYYRQFGWKEGDMEDAEEYYKQCLSLPMYPTLNDEEQQYVINSINEFFEK